MRKFFQDLIKNIWKPEVQLEKIGWSGLSRER